MKLTPSGAAPSDSGFDHDAYLRLQRNVKLSESDWTQGNDTPLSNSKKTEWATYRQALRDLPDNTSDSSDPTWPSEPS